MKINRSNTLISVGCFDFVLSKCRSTARVKRMNELNTFTRHIE